MPTLSVIDKGFFKFIYFKFVLPRHRSAIILCWMVSLKEKTNGPLVLYWQLMRPAGIDSSGRFMQCVVLDYILIVSLV